MNMQKVPETPLTCEIRAALEEYTQRLMKLYPERFTKADHEAWREECRKKQSAGVKFEVIGVGGFVWLPYVGGFENGNKEHYREVPQEVFASECQKAALEHLAKTYSADKGTAQLNPPTPHAAERALWKAQREAGTNEVWQCCAKTNVRNWVDLDAKYEPNWVSGCVYRVKPMKLTARICRFNKNAPLGKVQDWEFYGTREEYRAECEKYGYAILSEIKEVVEKPKTVKYYFAMYKMTIGNINTIYGLDKEWILDWTDRCGHTIIGNIEEREV